MKTSSKKILKFAKFVWFVLGFLILFAIVFSFFQMNEDLGLIVWVIYLSYSVFALVIYVAITLLFLLIKWFIKFFSQKNLREK